MKKLVMMTLLWSSLFSWGQIAYLGSNTYMINAASIYYNSHTYICVVYSNGSPHNTPVDLKAIIFDENGTIHFNGVFASNAEIVLALFIYGDPNYGRFYIYWDDDTRYSGYDDSNIRYAILDVNSGVLRSEWITNSSTVWYNVGKVVPEDYLKYTSPTGYVVWGGYDNNINFSFAYLAKISTNGVLDIDTILAIPSSAGALGHFYLLYHQNEQSLYVVYNLDDPNTSYDIYATKYSLNGQGVWPQFTEVCAYTDWQKLSTEEDVVEVVAQENGGFIVAWEDKRSGTPYIYLQKMDQSGNKIWGTYGIQLNFNYEVWGDIYLRTQNLYVGNYYDDIFLTSGFNVSGNWKSCIFLIDNSNANILNSVVPNYICYEEVIAKGLTTFGFSLNRTDYENEIYSWDPTSGNFDYYGILDIIPNEQGHFILVDNDYTGIAVAIRDNNQYLYAQPLVSATKINEKQMENSFYSSPFRRCSLIIKNYKDLKMDNIIISNLQGRRSTVFKTSGAYFIKEKTKLYKVIFIR